ncbi:MAG: hypothetical protein WCE21_01935 [Candidatus Babeliales bacterium]
MKNTTHVLLCFFCFAITIGYIHAAEQTQSLETSEKKGTIDERTKMLCAVLAKLSPIGQSQQSLLPIARTALPREIVNYIFAYAYNQTALENNIPLYWNDTQNVLHNIILERLDLDQKDSFTFLIPSSVHSLCRSHALDYYRQKCYAFKWSKSQEKKLQCFAIPIDQYTHHYKKQMCIHEPTNNPTLLLQYNESEKRTQLFKGSTGRANIPGIVESYSLDHRHEQGITAAVITNKKNDVGNSIQSDLWVVIKEDSDETTSTFVPYILPHPFKKIAHLPTLPYTLLGLTAQGDVYTIALQRPRINEPRIQCFKQNLSFLNALDKKNTQKTKKIIDFSTNPQSPGMVALLVTADTENNAYQHNSSSTFELYTALLGFATGKAYVKKVATFTNDYLDLLKPRLFPESFPLTEKIKTAVTLREGVAEIRNSVFLQEPISGNNVGKNIFGNRLFYCPQFFDSKNIRTMQTDSSEHPNQTVQTAEK